MRCAYLASKSCQILYVQVLHDIASLQVSGPVSRIAVNSSKTQRRPILTQFYNHTR